MKCTEYIRNTYRNSGPALDVFVVEDYDNSIDQQGMGHLTGVIDRQRTRSDADREATRQSRRAASKSYLHRGE